MNTKERRELEEKYVNKVMRLTYLKDTKKINEWLILILEVSRNNVTYLILPEGIVSCMSTGSFKDRLIKSRWLTDFELELIDLESYNDDNRFI